jgi:uncharacterized protein with PIN domain
MTRVVDNSIKPKQVRCPKCTRLLEYVGTDVQSKAYTDMSGCYDVSNWIVCPVCGDNVSVEAWRGP